MEKEALANKINIIQTEQTRNKYDLYNNMLRLFGRL